MPIKQFVNTVAMTFEWHNVYQFSMMARYLVRYIVLKLKMIIRFKRL